MVYKEDVIMWLDGYQQKCRSTNPLFKWTDMNRMDLIRLCIKKCGYTENKKNYDKIRKVLRGVQDSGQLI